MMDPMTNPYILAAAIGLSVGVTPPIKYHDQPPRDKAAQAARKSQRQRRRAARKRNRRKGK